MIKNDFSDNILHVFLMPKLNNFRLFSMIFIFLASKNLYPIKNINTLLLKNHTLSISKKITKILYNIK